MRYTGWIVAIILLIFDLLFYHFNYRHLKNEIESLKQEIKMWEDLVEREKNAHRVETRFTFPMEKFLAPEVDRLSSYGEVELARILNALKGRKIEILISGNNPARYTAQIMKFISEQNLPLDDFRIEGRNKPQKQLIIIAR
ncbi:MAG: hypothetical protein ABIL05_01600 [candidate division WOR-3 bacterium]